MEIKTLYFNHNCNSYLLVNNSNCLLIDPGFNNNNCLINAINKLNLTLKGILLTHGHYDHIEGLKNIKNVPVYMYEGEESCLVNSTHNCSFFTSNKFTIEDIKPITFIDGEELNLINIKIKVIHTPFHTSGSCCFYIKELKSVITGDTLFFHTIGRSDLPTSQPRFISSSLNKLFKLPHEINNDTTVYPGHGIKTTLSSEYKSLKSSCLF